MSLSELGVIGLAVMGKNLARNVANKKFKVTVYNRTTSKMTEFINDYGHEFLVGEKTLKAFVESIKKPRKIMVMVKAGPAVDAIIESLTPLLDKGDIIIDGGNSFYRDTERRFIELKKEGIQFMGCGVSGGEEGALNGPSLMPGGSKKAYNSTKKIFSAIAAKDFLGEPCVTYVGNGAAGHYVKMIHNGIEYGIMQLMAETYSIYRKVYSLPATKIANIFDTWNRGKLESFLFRISVPVLKKEDEKDKKSFLVYKILDKAENKGTGKWASIDSLERGIAIPSITQAVYSRYISTEKEERVKLNKIYQPKHKKNISLGKFTKLMEDALYTAMISIYAQGYDLMQRASREEGWDIDLSEISRIWEGGCIIRARLLKNIHDSYALQKNKQDHLFALPEISKIMKVGIPKLRKITASSTETGINIPALSSALHYFEAMTEERLPANFIQGLRDYFGAHTYERTDKKGIFHTDWD